MLHLLNVGDKVKVWPRPGREVPSAPPTAIETPAGVQILLARSLRSDGEEVRWSAWLQEQARQGDVLFSDPGAKGEGIRAAVHVRHPHECGTDGKPAHEGGANSPEELAHWKALGHEGGKMKSAPSEKAKG